MTEDRGRQGRQDRRQTESDTTHGGRTRGEAATPESAPRRAAREDTPESAPRRSAREDTPDLDMSRERARIERRDLDKERGEPISPERMPGTPRSLRRVAKPLGDWTSRPRILITNDDGIESRGLLALKEALEPIGETFVVAPESNQSAVGHTKTLMRPLRVRERKLADGSTGWSVDGSPTDAVSLAFLGFFGHGFDLVASGINYGANLGDDITYSGTVSAAMEGVINGCPSFAISQEYYEHPDFGLASLAAGVVARNVLEHGLSRGELINVNVPACRIEDCGGIEITRLGKRVYQDQLIQRVDPRGIPYYWIGGPPPSGLAVPGTDFHAVVNRRVAVTPIHLDLTGRRLLRRLRTWSWPLAAEGLPVAAEAAAAGGEGAAERTDEERIEEERRLERR